MNLFLNDDEAVSTRHAVSDSLTIQRGDPAQVNHLCVDTFCGQGFSSAQYAWHHQKCGNDGDVAAMTHNVGTSHLRQGSRAIHQSFLRIHALVFEKDHRIIQTYRCTQEPICGRGRTGGDDSTTTPSQPPRPPTRRLLRAKPPPRPP